MDASLDDTASNASNVIIIKEPIVSWSRFSCCSFVCGIVQLEKFSVQFDNFTENLSQISSVLDNFEGNLPKMAVEVDTNVVNTVLNDVAPISSSVSIPKWLNSEFVELHLQKCFSDKQIKIVGFEVKPATASGENYASCIYRAKVTFTDEAHQLTNNNEVIHSISN